MGWRRGWGFGHWGKLGHILANTEVQKCIHNNLSNVCELLTVVLKTHERLNDNRLEKLLWQCATCKTSLVTLGSIDMIAGNSFRDNIVFVFIISPRTMNTLFISVHDSPSAIGRPRSCTVWSDCKDERFCGYGCQDGMTIIATCTTKNYSEPWSTSQ